MPEQLPLCVDLDGTLLRTDTLLESFLVLLKTSPVSAFQIPLWLSAGRANLKRQITDRVELDVNSLPLNTELLEYLQQEYERGRALVLVTGANQTIAEAVAARLGLFKEVLSSDGRVNLTGKKKADMLQERFGQGKFDYAGNEQKDLAVWAVARRAIVVNGGNEVVRKAKALCELGEVFEKKPPGVRTWWRALRVHQWTKNLLLVVPLLGAHHFSDLHRLVAVLLGFIAFSCCASSVYLSNDLLDLQADRQHTAKRYRPFASGQIPLLWGVAGAAILLLVGVSVASLLLPWTFFASLGIYCFLAFTYSLYFKRVEILDVFVLAGLYGIRVFAGGLAARVPVSDWLLVFSIFLFLSLAFAKRFTELQANQSGKNEKLKGRGYQGSDLQLVSSMGVGSGYLAVLVLALYITNPLVTQLYQRPESLWFACPVLLYWISRVWLLAHRGVLHNDPILFALKDKQSWLIVFILLSIGMAALPV